MSTRLLDLVDPTHAELAAAVPLLDPEALEWLSARAGDGRDARPLIESHGHAVVSLLLLPAHLDHENRFAYLELGVVITPDQLITVRKSGPNGRVAEPPVGDGTASDADETAGVLFHGIVDDVAEAYLNLVDALYVEIDELEDHIDELPGDATRHRLSSLRHEMLHARKNVTALRAAVRRVIDGRLGIHEERLFPREVELAFADTYDTLVRVTEELDVARDLLASVRDHLQAKIAESQNEVVKRLTVVASLVLVPTLITGFYGQNFEGAFDGTLWGIDWSLGLIVATTLGQLAVFRWKRWI